MHCIIYSPTKTTSRPRCYIHIYDISSESISTDNPSALLGNKDISRWTHTLRTGEPDSALSFTANPNSPGLSLTCFAHLDHPPLAPQLLPCVPATTLIRTLFDRYIVREFSAGADLLSNELNSTTLRNLDPVELAALQHDYVPRVHASP